MKLPYHIPKELIKDSKCCKFQQGCLNNNSCPDCKVVEGRTECCVLVQPKLYLPDCGYHYEIHGWNGDSIHACFCDVKKTHIYEKSHSGEKM